MSSNFLIGWPNRIDTATVTSAPGSWATAHPLTNLQTRDSSQVALSADATTAKTKFTVTFSAATSVRVVSLFRFSGDADALWRITGDITAAWVTCWPAGYTSTLRRDPVLVFPAGTTATTFDIEIDNTTNADGYVQAARVFVGGGFQPIHNASYAGFAQDFEDLSSVQQLDSGAVYTYQRPVRRIARMGFDALSQSLEFATINEMLRTQGMTQEVWFAPWPGEPARLQADGYMALLRRMSPIEYPYYRTRKVGIELAEIL